MNTHFESLYPSNSWNKEIEQLITFVKEGNSNQLIGLPGVGRANLLLLLSYNEPVRKLHLQSNEQWFLFVLANFSEVKEKTLTEILKFLLLSIQESLREQNKEEELKHVAVIASEAKQSLDELVILSILKQTIDYLCIQKQLTLVLLFDKFEYYTKTLTSELFYYLSVLRSRAKYRFSVVFSIDRPLEDYFDPHFFAEFYSIFAGHNIYLPLSDKPALDFRISYIEKAAEKTIPENVKKDILQLTGSHANYTRITIEEFLAYEDLAGQTNKDLRGLLKENRAIRSVSYEIWEGLRASEQNFLKYVIARSTEATEAIPALPADRSETASSQASRSDKKSYLKLAGLVQDNKITIPLFEDFVRYRAEHLSNGKITFDSQINEIKKGEFSITHLTALEFKILKFFLEHEGILVSRDEVIQGVWKDLSSTAGVTEQALDQLIFRVRKKIEDNPNNPIHLQTIKGRGFRFTS